MIADEKFFAWLDGELSGTEAEDMARRVAADPELARLAEQHETMKQRLGAAFQTVVDEPIPPAVAAAARARDADVVQLQPERKAWLKEPAPWMSLAATLAVGILIGTMVPQRQVAPLQSRDGAIYAAAGLADALDTQLASAGNDGAVHIGITFRNGSGAICRSFSGQGSSGVACRQRGAWRIRGLFADQEGQASDYRMAGGIDPQLADLIESMIADEPLDAAGERAAMESGWR